MQTGLYSGSFRFWKSDFEFQRRLTPPGYDMKQKACLLDEMF
jgi:hypothetical protein